MTEENKNAADRELAISRVLNAPRELVFEVWTNPDHIKNWYGPTGFTNTIQKMDVKPGGEWIHVLHGPDGTDYDNKSVFKEVIKPEKIVFDHFNPNFETTVTFTAQGNKTLLTMRMVFESFEVKDFVVKNHKADIGQKQNIDKLENYLQTLKS